MAERPLIGTFGGVEFYADPQIASGTVVFHNAVAIDPDVDFACGGTDTEPQEPEYDAVMMAMDNFIYGILFPEMRERIDDQLLAEMFGDPASTSDLLAITRSIARGS